MHKIAVNFLGRYWHHKTKEEKLRPMPFESLGMPANRESEAFCFRQELRRNRRLIATILTLSVLTVVLEVIAHIGFVTVTPMTTANREAQRVNHQDLVSYPLARNQCGSSPAEARELGCFFDELSFAWQVPECYDEKTIDEFLLAGEWEYFMDEAGTTTVPHDILAQGGQAVHVTSEFHITHCLYLRRQMVRLIQRGGPMDNHLGIYKHTVHCGMVMLSTAGYNKDFHTRAPVIYPVCKALQEWRI